ncbi:FecR domain-containing protein [Dyadobacter sp. CY345]|uniref:FecR family protein n=1 Tax=Dyadobacter sp. CY345 TaxID=2909335 RepID=UPI001F478193|nr:FecR domain-containing protein [Dyadobacter sp. CY345]MCF2442560.1 FecR domain-containing protein [Dyadobacter sp. CY345]
MKVTKELVMLYFQGKCSDADEAMVEVWMSESPYHGELAEQWLMELDHENKELLVELAISKNDIWNNTSQEIDNIADEAFLKIENEDKINSINFNWTSLAAVLMGITVVAFCFFLHSKNKSVEIATEFGQIRHITLPDSSKVVLNGNSKIKYNRSWDENPREIWLDGEAFFSITHLKNNARFIVHLSSGKKIEVLGTEFNVINRPNHDCVVLKSGSIKLSLPEKTGAEKEIYLKPGDLIETDETFAKKSDVKKAVVNPETYYSWTNGKWTLDGTSLGEMLVHVEENYGLHVEVANVQLLKKRLSGSIPLSDNNPALLIEDIAHLFQLKLEKKDNKLVLAE